jgi:hypothetical protein
MLVFVEDAAEAIASSYVEEGDLVGPVIGAGSERSGRAFAMPWCGPLRARGERQPLATVGHVPRKAEASSPAHVRAS